jgi:hypothetical protein
MDFETIRSLDYGGVLVYVEQARAEGQRRKAQTLMLAAPMQTIIKSKEKEV